MPMPWTYRQASREWQAFLADAQDAIGTPTDHSTFTAVEGTQIGAGQYADLREAGAGRTAALAGGLSHRQHLGQGGEVDAVLALVVGRAAPIPALALDLQRPGVQAGAPAAFLAADHVAMAVGEEGGKGRVLDPAGHQHRPAARVGVGQHLAGEAQGLQAGADLAAQVGLQGRAGGAGVALGAAGHAAGEVGLEAALVEVLAQGVEQGVAGGGGHHREF